MKPASVSESDLFALVARFQSGDELAFVSLWRECLRRVFFWCRSAGDSRLPDQECEDLCSEVMVRVYEKAPATRFQNGLHFLHWLKMVTLNLKTDHLRQYGRRANAYRKLALEKTDAADAEPDGLETLETDRGLDRVVSRLDAEDETLLSLHLRDGKTFPEIAVLLENDADKAGKYKKRYYRLLDEIRRQLTREFPGVK